MRVPAVFCSVLFLGACEASESPPGNVVVVYVSHDLVFSRPILKDFERQSGLRVRIVGDTEASKTTGLALKLRRLKDRPEADVFWNNEVVRTVQLADLGLLEAYVPATAVGIPLEHCDGAGRWVGFAARARVLLYNTELINVADAPKSIFDLTDERREILNRPQYRALGVGLAGKLHDYDDGTVAATPQVSHCGIRPFSSRHASAASTGSGSHRSQFHVSLPP